VAPLFWPPVARESGGVSNLLALFKDLDVLPRSTSCDTESGVWEAVFPGRGRIEQVGVMFIGLNNLSQDDRLHSSVRFHDRVRLRT